MSYRSLKYAFLVAPLFLGACGEGYDLVKVGDVFPYGNQRTAGSAYAYVLSSLMPERTLNLEPVSSKAKKEVPVTEAAPVQPSALQETMDIISELESDLEQVFEEAQRK